MGALALAGCRDRGAGAVPDPGSHDQSVESNGATRTYRLHVPPSYDGGQAMPLVIAFHGSGGQGASMEARTGLSDLADREGFVVAYPDAVNQRWQYGPTSDDLAFIDDMLTQIESRIVIDSGRVYATGMSDGGFFTQFYACNRPDTIAAIAPVAASMTARQAAVCAQGRAIPILAFHGTDDPTVTWDGIDAGVQRFLSVPDTMHAWALRDGCSATPDVADEPDTDPNDGTTVRRESFPGCQDGAEVVLEAIEGGGHTWPGGLQYQPVRVVGRTSHDINASDMIWQFFARHPMPGR
jgi:polyhydroxybutyrate depolymerase